MLYYILKICVIILAVTPIYLILRKPWRRMKEGRAGSRREVFLAVFVLFHAGLLGLALWGEYGTPVHMAQRAAERIESGEKINLIPFRTINSFFTCRDTDAFMVNIVGNIVMFMPWGFGNVLLWEKRRNVWAVACFSSLLPLLIEVSQLFIERSVDVDDFILNFLGSSLGAVLFFPLRKRLRKGVSGSD